MDNWYYRAWKRKAAFVLTFCILLGGIRELPFPNLSAAAPEEITVSGNGAEVQDEEGVQPGAGAGTQEGAGEQPGAGAGEQPGTDAGTQEGAGEQPGTGAGEEQSGVGAGEQPGAGAGEQPGADAGEQPGTGAGEQSGVGAGEQPGTGAGEQSGTGAGVQPGTEAGTQEDAATVSGNDAAASNSPMSGTQAKLGFLGKMALFALGRPAGDMTASTGEVKIEISDFKVLDASDPSHELVYSSSISGGKEICTIDPATVNYYDVAKVSFKMDVTVLKNSEDRNLIEGDYLLIPIPKGFSGAGLLEDMDAGHHDTIQTGGVAIAYFGRTMVGAQEMLKIEFANSVNKDQGNDDIKGGMNITLNFTGKDVSGGQEITMLPALLGQQEMVLKLPPLPSEIKGITKDGQLNADNEAEWTIKVGTDPLSKGASLNGVVLKEALPDTLHLKQDAGGYVITATSEKGPVDVAVDPVTNELTLSGANAVAPITVKVTTTIDAQKLEEAITDYKADPLNPSKQVLTLENNVTIDSIVDENLNIPTTLSATKDVGLKLCPGLNKQGEQIDSNTIRWTITVNSASDPVRVYRGYIVDPLPTGLTYKPGTFTYKRGEEAAVATEPETVSRPAATNPWGDRTHKLWVEGSTDQILYFYMPEDTRDTYTITFDTTVGNGFGTSGGGTDVTNKASVHAEFPVGSGPNPSVDYGIPDAVTTFRTAKVNKEVVKIDPNVLTGQLTWGIYPSVRLDSYTSAVLTDTITDDQAYVDGSVTVWERGASWEDKTDVTTLNIFQVDTSGLTGNPGTLKLTFNRTTANGRGKELSDYYIEYQTTALTYLRTNHVEHKYVNSVKLDVDGNTSTDSAEAELKNDWSTKTTTFEHIDGKPYFHYTIAVNESNIAGLTGVTVHDNLNGAIRLGPDGTGADVSADWQFDTARTKVWQEAGGSKTDITGSCSVAYTSENREATITLGNLSTKATIELYAAYTGDLAQLTAKGSGTGDYADQKIYSNNTAEVSSNEIQKAGGDPISVASSNANTVMDNKVVTKTNLDKTSGDGTPKLYWRVIINPNSGTMGQITIEDTILKSQKYIEDSVMLYDAVYTGGAWQPDGIGRSVVVTAAPTPGADSVQFDVDATNRTMNLTVNDVGNKPLILEYQTLLMDGSKTEVSNTLHASYGGNNYDDATGKKTLDGGNWGQMTSARTLTLIKQDASVGAAMPLKDVDFAVYEDEACTRKVDTGTTGADGKVSFFLDLPTGVQEKTFYYREMNTPSGYQPNTAAVYEVTIRRTGPREIKVTVPNNRIQQSTSRVELEKTFSYWNTAVTPPSSQAVSGKKAAFTLVFYPLGVGVNAAGKVVDAGGNVIAPANTRSVSFTESGTPGEYNYNTGSTGDTGTKLWTDESGQIVLNGLPWGYYGITETDTADGFQLDAEERIFQIKNTSAMEVEYYLAGTNTANDNGRKMANQATQFTVAAYEAPDTTNPVSNMRLQICKQNPDGTPGTVIKDLMNPGELEYAWNTGTTPETICNLPAGTYVLHEDAESSTNLHYAVAKDVTFTVRPDGTVTDADGNPWAGKLVKIFYTKLDLKVTKVDQFDAPVAGAALEMTNKPGTLVYSQSITTPADGKGFFDNLVRGGEYTLTETVTPADHKPVQPITVKVSPDGSSITLTQQGTGGSDVPLALHADGTLHVVDKKLIVPIAVKKADGTAPGTFLAGAEFTLYGLKAGDTVWQKFCDFTTGTDGSWNISGLANTVMNPFDNTTKLSLGLKPGSYVLIETKAPNGYRLTGSEPADGVFPEGTRMWFTIDADGNIQLGTVAHPVADPASYPMTVDRTTFTISDIPYTLRIQPLEFDDGVSSGMDHGRDLNDTGAEYTVTGDFAKTDGTIGSDTVTLSGTEDGAFALSNALRGRLIPGKVYTITETKTPEGYLAPATVYVKLDNQGQAILCDSFGNPISNHACCKTENQTGLPGGTADGCDGLVKIYHGVTRAQLIKYTSWDNAAKTEVTGWANYKTLSGITFAVKGHFAGSVGSETRSGYVTDADGKIVFRGELVEGETYTLTETPRTGYQALADMTFTYTAAGITGITPPPDSNFIKTETLDGMATLKVTNQSAQNTSLQFLVYDCADGAGIPGAQFRLTGTLSGGGSVDEVITTSEAGTVCTYATAGETHEKVTTAGEAFVTNLQPGEYTLTQIPVEADPVNGLTPPYGYEQGENGITITFKVDAAARNQTIVINEANIESGAYDLTVTADGPKVVSKGICYKRLPGTVLIEKQDHDDHTPLNGVGFAIYRYKEADSVFELLQNLVTGKAYVVASGAWTETGAGNGEIKITGLDWGRYYIVETNPLTGYVKDKTRYEFEIGRDTPTQVLDWTPGVFTNAKRQIVVPPAAFGSGHVRAAGCRMRLSGSFQDSALSCIEWEETEEDYEIGGLLVPGEIYTLEETGAAPGCAFGPRVRFRYMGYGTPPEIIPDGASGDDPAEIMVDADGTMKLVRKADPLRVRIRKMDENGNLLAGAVLSLYVQEAGTKVLVAEATTDGSPWELTGDLYSQLRVGAVYILTEKSAPAGYALAEDVTFTLTDSTEWQEYTMTDRREEEGAGSDEGSASGAAAAGLRTTAAVLPRTGREERGGFLAAGGALVAAGVLLQLHDRRRAARKRRKK